MSQDVVSVLAANIMLKELRRIYDELNEMGVGGDESISGTDAVDYLNTLHERLYPFMEGK